MNIAIIPARAGSKRLPGKNIANIGGQPLVVRAFSLALRSSCFGAVVCTTDDIAVKEFARQHMVGLHHRLPEHAHDTATTESAVLDALHGFPGDALVTLLQPTSPLTLTADVLRTINAAKAGGLGAFTSTDGKRPSGNVYCMSLRRLRQGKPFAHPRCAKTRIPHQRAVDIDTAEDFARAEAAMRSNARN